MRLLVLSSVLLLCGRLSAQTAPRLAVAPPAQIQASLTRALSGDWTGVLEYTDPESPAKRLQTPTWLSITPSGDSLTFHYLYDDGPAKLVEQTQTITLDVAAAAYRITAANHRAETYRVEGYESLHDGHGDLMLLGPSIDQDRPVGTHITLTVRRNFLAWTEENRASSVSPFAFRHRYVFTRSTPPKTSANR